MYAIYLINPDYSVEFLYTVEDSDVAEITCVNMIENKGGDCVSAFYLDIDSDNSVPFQVTLREYKKNDNFIPK